ncbi:MAG: hypothetical protein M3Q65_24400, partial [Chloroflexota bacterium]|nr:hypothetical protein [Chloroflexota bacterium]
ATAVPPATGKKGHPFTRVRLAPDAPAPVRVDALAAQVPASAWQVAQIQDGSKGPLVVAVAFVRAVAVRDGLPGPDVWVVLRRALDGTRELKAYLSNAGADTPPETLVWLLGLRWPVEQAIKEAKEGLGLAHYEVRGWHHHTAMTLLAQGFLTRLRGRLGGEGAGADRAASPPPARGDAPRSAARRRGDARLHPGDPAPQLRCRTLPPQAPPAAVAAPGQLLSQLTL